MEYVTIYFIGAYLMLVWSSFRHTDEVANFIASLAWPITLALIILLFPFFTAAEKGYHVQFVSRKYDDLSSWGYRKSTRFKYGCAIRCPWFEVQLFNSNILKEDNA